MKINVKAKDQTYTLGLPPVFFSEKLVEDAIASTKIPTDNVKIETDLYNCDSVDEFFRFYDNKAKEVRITFQLDQSKDSKIYVILGSSSGNSIWSFFTTNEVIGVAHNLRSSIRKHRLGPSFITSIWFVFLFPFFAPVIFQISVTKFYGDNQFGDLSIPAYGTIAVLSFMFFRLFTRPMINIKRSTFSKSLFNLLRYLGSHTMTAVISALATLFITKWLGS